MCDARFFIGVKKGDLLQGLNDFLKELNFEVYPDPYDKRSDIVQAIQSFAV